MISKVDPYTLLMVALTGIMLGIFAITKDPVILDLIKISFGVTVGTLAKKAETTTVVVDSNSVEGKSILSKYK